MMGVVGFAGAPALRVLAELNTGLCACVGFDADWAGAKLDLALSDTKVSAVQSQDDMRLLPC